MYIKRTQETSLFVDGNWINSGGSYQFFYMRTNNCNSNDLRNGKLANHRVEPRTPLLIISHCTPSTANQSGVSD